MQKSSSSPSKAALSLTAKNEGLCERTSNRFATLSLLIVTASVACLVGRLTQGASEATSHTCIYARAEKRRAAPHVALAHAHPVYCQERPRRRRLRQSEFKRAR